MTDDTADGFGAQRQVAAFIAEHDLQAPAAYRLLDVHAELGELASEVVGSTRYGADPATVTVAEDEVGDALFALLAFAEAVGVDAGTALETAMEKYEDRIATTGDAASGK